MRFPAASNTHPGLFVNDQAVGRGTHSAFSLPLLVPAYPVAALDFSPSGIGREFTRRPRGFPGVGRLFAGSRWHGSIARFISSLVYQGRRASIHTPM